MKKIGIPLIITTLTLLAQAPSQNSALKDISPSGTEKKSNSAMQNSLDNWLKEDWEPTQKKIEAEEKVSHVEGKENNDSNFKLQTYVNKWEKYNKKKAKEPKKASHAEMLNTLRVIGK